MPALFFICRMRILCILLILFSFLSHAQWSHFYVDQKTDNASEPSIAINPVNTDSIYVASVLQNIALSSDGGETWDSRIAKSKFGVYGDPVLHFNDKNTLMYLHLSKTSGKEWGEWFDRIVYQELHNGLANMTTHDKEIGFNQDKVQDKHWVSTDNYSEKHKGNTYVTWTEFDVYGSKDVNDKSRIRFSKLAPNDSVFSQAITISDTTGDCEDGDHTLEGATTAVGPFGEIYCTWAGHNNIYFDKSLDGGITWSKDEIIAKQENGWAMDMPNIGRANGMPFLAIDKSKTTSKGNLYLVWADERNGHADIWLKMSTNQGESWSKAIKLNRDGGNSHQYFPNLTINQETGKVYVAYYDQRNSANALFYDIYVSEFSPQDAIIKDYKVNENPIPLPGNKFFFGDYLDLDCQKDLLALVYPVFSPESGSQIVLSKTKLSRGLQSSSTSSLTYSISRKNDTLFLNVSSRDKARISYKVKVKKTNKAKLKGTTTKGVYEGQNMCYHIPLIPGQTGTIKFKISTASRTLTLKAKLETLIIAEQYQP